MKAFFYTLAALLLGSSAIAQPAIDIEIRNAVTAPGGTSSTFEIWARGGANYVSQTVASPPAAPNPDGSWTGMTLRFDINPLPAGLATATFSNSFNPAYASVGGAVLSLGAVGVTFGRTDGPGSPSDLPIGNTPGTYVRLGTITINYGLVPAIGMQSVTPRQVPGAAGSRWSNTASPATSRPFFFSAASTPLGVDLLTFSATATPERTTKLEWQTATEKNSAHFIVERSADGQRFTDQVCRMQAAGTSNDLLTYHNFDYKPLTGDNYYRLKMVDKDGTYKYSETRRVHFNAPIADVSAIPNPFQSATAIRVNADLDQMVNYTAMDYAGRIVRSGVWEVKKGLQEFPMPLEDAAAGNYILTVQGSTILAELKLTKTN